MITDENNEIDDKKLTLQDFEKLIAMSIFYRQFLEREIYNKKSNLRKKMNDEIEYIGNLLMKLDNNRKDIK